MEDIKLLDRVKSMVDKLLGERSDVLDHWRRQRLTTSGRVKNFENWILVELVHQLWNSGIVKQIRTNGTVEGRSYTGNPLSSGRKAQSGSLSPDLAIRTTKDFILDIEIKTQVSPQSVINDIIIVKNHNEKEAKSNYRACFLWIVVAPCDSTLEKRVWKSVEGIKAKVNRELRVNIEEYKIKPWLHYYIAAPFM